ncbi:hypothetical protein BO82DRAFT_355352 [Aspergillus uvarum CBS 121591]|uniref:Uncharacterized protein n=1 Tax=Aspergillus uvarum CBS 121591 TaxID=1448315 RepID=A0A319CPG1_9EURO|nr:hypothetical protein BO82DRAFT_355352 [Aspergillus uvarum CBS 121591]PYH80633.1 hypothetical protein BO82DRAFT_355352 [Aspergillus uvarum CBS 121591]
MILLTPLGFSSWCGPAGVLFSFLFFLSATTRFPQDQPDIGDMHNCLYEEAPPTKRENFQSRE